MLFVNFTILDLTSNQVLSDVWGSIAYYNSICSVRCLGKHSIIQQHITTAHVLSDIRGSIAYYNSTCSVRR